MSTTVVRCWLELADGSNDVFVWKPAFLPDKGENITHAVPDPDKPGRHRSAIFNVIEREFFVINRGEGTEIALHCKQRGWWSP